jgi:hypothetical protein
MIMARSEGNQFIALQHTAPGMQLGISGIATCGRISRFSGVAIRMLTYPIPLAERAYGCLRK